MAQKRLTINLPRSTDALHNALQMLLQYGLISEKKAQVIERKQEETTRKPGEKSRWAPDFINLPLSERRKIMKKQAEQMVVYYKKTAVEREEWQGGDFIDEY